MPELPEVETVVRSLRPSLIGSSIHTIKAHWPRSLEGHSEKWYNTHITQQTITAVERRAKWILLVFENDIRLAIHLRMTGKLYPCNPDQLKALNLFHISAIFKLNSGQYLVFEDQRRFGRIKYIKNESNYLEFSKKFGPEPLEKEFSYKWLLNALSKSKRKIKPLLLDQAFLAGLGNIYVDEALWLSSIHPEMPANKIEVAQVKNLKKSICKVLQKSIQSNGTTFMNFKFLGGQEGGYTDHMLVFRRTGQPCFRCQTLIRRIKVSQRSTHYCPDCQNI